MKYGVLYSGSSGNCTFVQIDDAVYLIDAGVSCKKIMVGLDVYGIKEEMIKGIFLTHEHTDHVVGLKQLVDKRSIPLYTNKETYAGIKPKYKPENIEEVHFLEDDRILFGELELLITAYRISHDVREGSFYIFERRDTKLVYITDTGYVADKYYEVMSNADGYIIESNHEPELVLQSRYPWHIQHRILSDKGHLSNQDCCQLLDVIIGDKTKYITLAHLSEENNNPDIAFQKVSSTLQQKGLHAVEVMVAGAENLSFPKLKIT